ncbi:MAG: hypothetical protein ABR585_07370 [Gemmatimonadaceae bacterium]
MTRPYTTDFAPTATPSNSQKLTPRGEATVRELIEQDETRLSGMRAAREDLLGEVGSITTVIDDLAQTIDRRRSLLVGDVISLLPTDTKVAPLFTPQGDAQAHASQWGDDPSPTGVHSDPRDTSQAPAWTFPDTQPDGYCIHCGQPAWRVPVAEVTPKGAKHSFGATCNPDNPDSDVAELVLPEGEVER